MVLLMLSFDTLGEGGIMHHQDDVICNQDFGVLVSIQNTI